MARFGFNSKLVRLKVRREESVGVVGKGFQFQTGSIKSQSSRTGERGPWEWFQFQTGSIKRTSETQDTMCFDDVSIPNWFD